MIGVVLAGGEGRRLGRPKAELRLDGASLAQRAAELLWPRCAEVLVSVRPGQRVAPTFVAIPDDAPDGAGPLAGIAACFRASGRSDLLVLACDYPRMSGDALDRLLGRARDDAELVFPVDARGRDHPLVGLWRRETAGRVQSAVEEGRYKVRALLRECDVQRVPVESLALDDAEAGDGGLLLNVNGPEEWRRAGGETI